MKKLHIHERHINQRERERERIEIFKDAVSDVSQTEKGSDQDQDFTSNEPKKRIQFSDKTSLFFMNNQILINVINKALNCRCSGPGNFRLVIVQYKGYNCNIHLQCQFREFYP